MVRAVGLFDFRAKRFHTVAMSTRIAGVVLLLAALSAASACSSSPSSPVPSPPLLVALQAESTPNAMEWNTVVIAGLDGQARAKATFTPIATPYVGCAGALLPRSAYLAAGKAFFADGEGVVRSLSPQGNVFQVTRFPLTSTQQMLSFAVSPDGKRVLGSVFTVPPKPDPPLACTTPPHLVPGAYTIGVYAADSGQPARLLYHEQLEVTPDTGPNVMAFIGWDAIGPVGTFPTLWATQGGGPQHYFGVPARIDATTGRVIRPVTDTDACWVQDLAANGDFLCKVLVTDILSVRRPDGVEIWQPRATRGSYYLAFLSPDEANVAVVGPENTVISRDGSVTRLAAMDIRGWIDSTTLIGGGIPTNFQYISLKSSMTVVDIGFHGMLIGAIPG